MKRLDTLVLLDVEALRLVLLGTSVIDWQRLAFTQRSDIDRFLRLCQFDPGSPTDQLWMRGVIDDAVNYLRETFRYRVPSQVAKPDNVQDLFMFASGLGEPRFRKISCIVLKLCHVIQHVEGRDLFHRLPMAEEQFGAMAEQRVNEVLQQMRDAGVPIKMARSSVKSRASLISKLLQKAETLAAEIYDRIRFQLVVERREDVLSVLHELTQRMFPFHLVVPSQSHNSLVDFRKICATIPSWQPFLSELQFGMDFSVGTERNGTTNQSEHNALSGSTYQILKFVVDMPLRIEDHLISPEIMAATRARTVNCLVEFQIVDAATAALNEQGDNDHERYKARQRLRILRRLSRGLLA